MLCLHTSICAWRSVCKQILARRFGVSREEQDAFAVESHSKAWAAQTAGRFNEEIVPVTVKVKIYAYIYMYIYITPPVLSMQEAMATAGHTLQMSKPGSKKSNT